MKRPDQSEYAPYYSRYIDLVPGDKIVATLEIQLTQTLDFLRGISETKSLHRYATDKWTIRQVWNHVNDTERVFVFRAFWFARAFAAPLPAFDQDECVKAASANEVSWTNHLEEFRRIRLATISLFKGLPDVAWSHTGIASDNPFTVRALAYITAGHVVHHSGIIRDRYL
jgi:hypothetical protein